MFAVRDWMTFQSAPQFVGSSTPEDPLLAAVRRALEDTARQARAEFPAAFAAADQLRARPGRAAQQIQPFAYSGPVAVCERCGAEFPPDHPSQTRCSLCKRAYRRSARCQTRLK